MRIAIAQTEIIYEQYEKNKTVAHSLMDMAQAMDARLLLFPEMSFTGFTMHTDYSIPVGQETVSWMQQAASAHQLYIGFGWVRTAASGKAENHYSIAAPDGTLVLDAVKLHPFSYAKEDQYFEKGNGLATCQIDDLRVGCFICYDLRFPEIFSAVSKKTDCILLPANWPERRRLHWCSLLSARAIENQVYLVGINCVGIQDGQRYSGDSRVIAPTGEIVLDCRNAAGCFLCEIDAKTVAETRRNFPVKQDRRPDFYRSIL